MAPKEMAMIPDSSMRIPESFEMEPNYYRGIMKKQFTNMQGAETAAEFILWNPNINYCFLFDSKKDAKKIFREKIKAKNPDAEIKRVEAELSEELNGITVKLI